MRSSSTSIVNGWIDAARGLLLILLLAGCQPDAHQAVLDDYLTRVARVARADAHAGDDRPGPGYPARRELAVAVPAQSIDVAEFIELHGCDMGGLVGFRNSPLGRMQTASQRLGYEFAWLEALARCGPGAADWLTRLGGDKRQSLPALFWNATFAADEMRTALGMGVPPPAGADLADLLRGLGDSLTALESGRFQVEVLERRLNGLRQGSWLGPARRDWARWRAYLGAAAAALDEAAPGVCLNRQPTPRSRRLYNVFVKLYVQRVQPELATRMRRHEAWIVELERLAERLAAVRPDAFEGWYRAVLARDDPGSEWSRTRRAVVSHAEAWQRLLAHCGIEPAPGLGQH